jgi:tetratricopeptide (TPR) repeat protein
LMCDTLLLALWVWSVVFFDRALRKNSPANFVASGALAGLAFWTKFPGLAIAPLLAAYGFCKSFPNLFAPLRGNRVRQAAPISDQSRLLETPTSGDLRAKTGLWLLTPALALVFVAAYEWVTWRLYGHGLFLASARFSSALRAREHGLIMGQLVGVSFLGGAFLPIIFYAPALWPDRKLRLAFLASMLFGFIGSFCNPFSAYVWHGRGNPDWTMLLQTILFIACGAQVLLLAVLNFWQERNAEALLLMLWTWGIFVFATVFNWTCNSRSLLPMLPAVSVLLAQRLIPDTADSVLSWRTLWPALPALALCLLVTQADYDLAESARCAAKDLCAKYGRSGRRVWFEHHWGFQYYMEQKGARALEIDLRQMQHGDLVVIPAEGIGGSDLPCNLVRIVDMLTYPPNRYFSTRSASAGAGFYAAIGGPYPFSAGCASPDCYYVFEVVQTLTEASQNGGLSSTGAVAEQFDVVRQAIALQQTLLTHPNDADAHLQLGRFFASRSNFAAAAKHFAEVLRLRPNDGAATAEMAALSLHAASSNTSAKQ